jgi:hypothetical protein
MQTSKQVTLIVSIAVLFCGQVYSSAVAQIVSATCTSEFSTPPDEKAGIGVQALLRDVETTTKWADVPAAVKAQLGELAERRLASFRARWAADALARKDAILLGCATPEMEAAIDEYYRKSYDTILPTTFSLKDIKNVELSRALVRNYLGAMAAHRATLTYPDGKLLNLDWDGKSLFDSIRLPDRQAFTDIKQYNASVAQALRNIEDATLNDREKPLQQEVLFDARARAVGAFSRDSFGGEDMETACEIIALHTDVVAGYRGDLGRPKIFASDDEVLSEVNAVYLHNTQLKWLDVGTLASTLKLTLCKGTDDDLEKYIGTPASNEVAKGIVLLRSWWIERVSASAEAQNKWSSYPAQDRRQIWEAFSADQRSNNDSSSSMETYKDQLEKYRNNMIAKYREVARLALRLVFPNDVILTSVQRQKVLEMVNAETAFGLFPIKIAAALDAAQGSIDGAAASAWKTALATHVATLGGNYVEGSPVRPEDDVAIKSMFEEVKAWVADRYQGYPIDIPSLYATFKFTVTTDGNATTSGSSGDIEFGVGTKRSKMEFYSILLHELRHAVNAAWRATASDKSKVISDMGMVREGSGVAVETLLLEPFLKDTLKDDLKYALYALDYGIRDARFTATTDATLQKYFRNGGSGADEPNTVDFTKSIAVSYGLTGALADTLALRAHVGTQYFQYISGGVQVVDDIAYLQSHIDASSKNKIDPFVLFACSLNNPRRDMRYVSGLKACMKL